MSQRRPPYYVIGFPFKIAKRAPSTFTEMSYTLQEVPHQDFVEFSFTLQGAPPQGLHWISIESPKNPYESPHRILIETPIESVQKFCRFPLTPQRYHINILVESRQKSFRIPLDPHRIFIKKPNRILLESPMSSSQKISRILWNPYRNPYMNHVESL